MGFYLVIFKKSLSTKNQDIKYNHLITNILHSIKIMVMALASSWKT